MATSGKTNSGAPLIAALNRMSKTPPTPGLKQRTPGQPGMPKAKTPPLPVPGQKQRTPGQPGMPKAKSPLVPGRVGKTGPDPRKASVFTSWR